MEDMECRLDEETELNKGCGGGNDENSAAESDDANGGTISESKGSVTTFSADADNGAAGPIDAI